MIKKITACLLALLLSLSAASATILPASGVDEEFFELTGLRCTPAVVLCQSLSVLDARGDQGGKKVATLRYSGKPVPVAESWDGYALVYYEDGTKTGWVRNEYLLMDPKWYVCDESVQVYAYPDTMAPRVGLVTKGTELPIITEYEDGRSVGGWVCVSLRGAAGWIRKNAGDTASDTWFRPEMLADATAAILTLNGENIFANAPADMAVLRALLTSAEDTGGMVAGCPFEATLTLYLSDGQMINMQLATDSCCVYRVDDRDYRYARSLKTDPDSSVSNEVLFELFGVYGGEHLPGNG